MKAGEVCRTKTVPNREATDAAFREQLVPRSRGDDSKCLSPRWTRRITPLSAQTVDIPRWKQRYLELHAARLPRQTFPARCRYALDTLRGTREPSGVITTVSSVMRERRGPGRRPSSATRRFRISDRKRTTTSPSTQFFPSDDYPLDKAKPTTTDRVQNLGDKEENVDA
jgi:hypothetical protein